MKIITHYHAYDETALKTYANAGLLRRAKKDVTAGKVSIFETITDKEPSITLESDGQFVSLPVDGLTHARCDCSSVSVCKHIIASVLYLQTIPIKTMPIETISDETLFDKKLSDKTVTDKSLSEEATIEETAEKDGSDKTSNEAIAKKEHTALSEILLLSITDFQKIAKTIPKAKRLKAFNMALHYFELSQNQHNTTTIINDNHSLCIQLNNQAEEILYICGAGFSGMLSKIERDTDSYHLLALLAVQQAYGKAEQCTNIQDWLQQELQDTEQGTHSQVVANAFQLSVSDVSMLDDLEFDISQLLSQGLSQVDGYSANRMHLANTLARSHYLPRLATTLRQLSGLMHDFVRGNNHINERKLLQSLANVSVYIYQLRQSTGDSLQKLRGKLRQMYDSDSQRPSLTLYPLGARWWQSQGRARGLTLYFYQVNEASNNENSNNGNSNGNSNGQVIEFTQARGQAKDISFDKYSAWYNSVWLSTSERLMNQRSVVGNPRFSDDVRYGTGDTDNDNRDNAVENANNPKLAVTGSKVESSQQISKNFNDYLTTITPFAEDDWQSLGKKWRQQLATEGKVNPLVVLNPAKIGGLLVDEVEQCVWWQLADCNDSQLRLRLDWQGNNQDTIAKIKKLENIDRHKITMVVAYVHVREQTITLEPITLVMQDKLFHLDYDVIKHKKSTLKELLSGKISKLMSKKRRLVEVDEHKPMTLSELVCEPILQVLESLSATGRLHPTEQQRQQLQRQLTLANDSGLSILAKELEILLAMNPLNKADGVDKDSYIHQLLYVVYICQLLQLLEVKVPVNVPALEAT